MCPACLTTLALIARGSTSVGSLTALAINKVRGSTGRTTIAVRVHAALPGPIDADMSRDVDIPKSSPEAVARGILDAVESGEEDIFPIPCQHPWFRSGATVGQRRLRFGVRGRETSKL